MKSRYQNYFKEHYNSTFTKEDILHYQQWFYPQYHFIESKVKPAGNVLEIGSGFGGFYSFLSNNNKKNYLGLELDSDAVHFANSYFKTNTFLNESLEEFTSTISFNLVYAFEVLEHLSNPILSIEKIHSFLENDGIFIGTSPYPYKKNVLADDTHTFVLHPENWKRLFLDSGFKRVEIIPMSFFPFLWRIHKNLNIKLPWYVPFKNFISTCLIIAKK